MHLVVPPGEDHFLFLLHGGLARLPTDWALTGNYPLILLTYFWIYNRLSFNILFAYLLGTVPREGFPFAEFSGDLHRLPAVFRDLAFFLREEFIERSSLGPRLDFSCAQVTHSLSWPLISFRFAANLAMFRHDLLFFFHPQSR